MKGNTKILSTVLVSASMLLSCVPSASDTAPYDIVLSGGRVIDPETGLDAVRDVGIAEGRIAAISERPLSGRFVEDVSGLVVAPGFIDLHAHGQHPVGQEYQVRDGVTTALEMEGGVWPVEKYYRLREGRALINYGGTVSHACARVYVMTGKDCLDLTESSIEAEDAFLEEVGNEPFYSSLSEEQLAAMLFEIHKGYQQGALGVGLAVEYLPGMGRKELYEIFKQVADANAIAFVHVRRAPSDAAPGERIAIAQEVIANAAVTGASAQIVHVASTGLGDTPTILEMIEAAQGRGIDITTEAYPYTAGSTSIGSALFDDGWRALFHADYGDLQWSETGERLTEETFSNYRSEQPNAFVILHAIPEQVVRDAMAHPVVSIASDGMPWWTNGEHPRGAGTFGRVLGKYVREERVLDLTLAIQKMTLMPARRLEQFVLSMKRKGRIQVGADADITVFNPDTVTDNATFAEPMQYSSGFEHVLVNGVFVVKNAEFVGDVFPGRPVLNKHVDVE